MKFLCPNKDGASFAPSNISGLDLWLRADTGVGVAGARQFTASDKCHLQIADNASVSTGNIDFTIAAWCYFDSVAADQAIVSKDRGDREYALVMFPASDYLNFYVFNNGGSYKVVNAGGAHTPAINTWYFVVAWYDATADAIKLEIDDGTTYSTDVASMTIADATAAFEIGSTQGGKWADGRISKVGFWKRTLTAAERTWLYNGGNGRVYGELGGSNDGAALKTSLISYWNLNETDGTAAAVDAHGSNNLTVTAAELVTNGAFASDTGWTKGTGWTISGGNASSDGTQSADADLSQSITLVDGNSYATSMVVSGYTAGNVTMTCGGQEGTDRAANGTHTENITASTADTGIIRADLDFVGNVDDVSIKARQITSVAGPQEGIATDSSGNDNHGYLTNMDSINAWSQDVPSVFTGTDEYSLEFDGTDDRVAIGTEIDEVNESWSLWFLADTVSGTDVMLSEWDVGNEALRFNSSTVIRVSTAGDVSGHADFTFSAFSVGTWYHLVITKQNKTYKAYVNGTESATGSIVSGDRFRVDAIGGYVTAAFTWDGKLKDVRCYDDVLTADEVTYLYNNGTSGTDPGTANLIGHWKFNDGPQGASPDDGDPIVTWQSREGSRHLFNQTTAAKRPTYVASSINGKPAINFDGSDDLLIKPSGFLTGTSGTIFIVFSMDTASRVLFAIGDEAADNDYLRMQAIVDGSNTQAAIISKSGGDWDEVKATNANSTSTTYICVYISDDSAWRIWRNGTEESIIVVTASNSGRWWGDISGVDNTTIGAAKTTSEVNRFDGQIAEIAVYDSELSDGEINKVLAYLNRRYAAY